MIRAKAWTRHRGARAATIGFVPTWSGSARMLPQAALEAAHVAAAECQVFLSVGTSTLVYPAAELPFVALNAGATVIEINPNPTSLTEAAHFSLRGSSGRVLPEIVQTAWYVESQFGTTRC